MNSEQKKALIRQYKDRPLRGGVFRIVNLQTGRYLLQAEPDLEGSRNRFDFMVTTNTCTFINMLADWKALGPAAFRFEVLEQVDAQEGQTPMEFRQDLMLLLEMWRDQFDPDKSY